MRVYIVIETNEFLVQNTYGILRTPQNINWVHAVYEKPEEAIKEAEAGNRLQESRRYEERRHRYVVQDFEVLEEKEVKDGES